MNLKVLRHKIQSLKSTQKVVKAMKLISAVKLKKSQEKSSAAQRYMNEIANMISILHAQSYDLRYPSMYQKNDSNKKLVILITGDRGLCGAFNSNIIKKLKNTNLKDTDIICIGKKGFSRSLKDMIKKVYTVSDINYTACEEIVNEISNMYSKAPYSTLEIFYNNFQNTLVQKPISRVILPIDDSNIKQHIEYICEPDEKALFLSLLNQYLGMLIYSLVLESIAGENASRMNAMDNALRNANKMISKMTLLLNRTRQAIITKELTEIIAGADALN